MAELFRFEISKIFRKKLVLFSVLGVLAFSGMMIISWGVNAYPIQGTDVMKHYTRKEAQKMNRDFLRQYQGKLTDEKVKAIIDSCRKKAENDEPRTYTELMIQKIFLDDNDQIRKVSEVFPEIGNQLVLGDVMGWDFFNYAFTSNVLIIGIGLIILLSPLFSDEYTTGMDGMILTSKYGKNKCAIAKVGAGFMTAIILTFVIILMYVLSFLILFGTAGYDAHMQLGMRGMYQQVPVLTTCLQAVIQTMTASVFSLLILAGMVMLISALCKSSFTTIILSAAVYFIPMFFTGKENMNLMRIIELFPIRMPRIFIFDKILGGLEIYSFQIPLTACMGIMAIVTFVGVFFLGKRIFAKHQVIS